MPTDRVVLGRPAETESPSSPSRKRRARRPRRAGRRPTTPGSSKPNRAAIGSAGSSTGAAIDPKPPASQPLSLEVRSRRPGMAPARPKRDEPARNPLGRASIPAKIDRDRATIGPDRVRKGIFGNEGLNVMKTGWQSATIHQTKPPRVGTGPAGVEFGRVWSGRPVAQAFGSRGGFSRVPRQSLRRVFSSSTVTLP